MRLRKSRELYIAAFPFFNRTNSVVYNLIHYTSTVEGRKRRVAAYARVSTDSDEQFTSFEAQVDYYTRYIEEHNEWLFVKVYADEHVIIGTSGENLVKSRGSALVPFSFLLRDKPKSFKSLKIINERL